MAEREDLTQEFAAELGEQTPAGPREEVDTPTLLALQDRVLATLKGQRLIKLRAEQRRKLAGQRPAEIQELIERLVGVLARRQDCARATRVSPAFCRLLSEQGLAVRGLIVTSDDVMRAAGDRALLAGQDTTDTCLRVGQRVRAFIQDPAADPDQRGDTRAAFGPVLHLEGEKHRRGQATGRRAEEKVAPLRDELAGRVTATEAIQRLDRFLDRLPQGGPREAPARGRAPARTRAPAKRRTTR